MLNRTERATVLGTSLPTLRALMHRQPDWPMVVRGRNGTPWPFELRAVLAFIGAQAGRNGGRHGSAR